MNLTAILIVFVVSQVVAVFTYWLASALVVRERATLKNAVLTYVQMFLATLGVAVLAGLGCFAAVRMGANPLVPGAIVVCGAVSVLIVAVAVPMHVYEIGVGGGFLFVLIVLVFNAAAGVAMGPWQPDFSKVPALQSLIKRDESPVVAQAPAPSAMSSAALAARRDELARRAQQLAIRRQYMPRSDAAAIAQYERDKATYDRDLAAYKEAAAAVK